MYVHTHAHIVFAHVIVAHIFCVFVIKNGWVNMRGKFVYKPLTTKCISSVKNNTQYFHNSYLILLQILTYLPYYDIIHYYSHPWNCSLLLIHYLLLCLHFCLQPTTCHPHLPQGALIIPVFSKLFVIIFVDTMFHAHTIQSHIISVDGLIFPADFNSFPPSAIHCLYSCVTVSLNSLLTYTS
jgi:hypothetical protein